jgi:LPS export ABC transporter protein LptC
MAISLLRRLVLAVAILPATALAACKNQPAATPKVAGNVIPDSADQIVFGVRHFLTANGVNKGELLSDTTFTYDDGTRLEMRRVHLTFYTALGTKDGVLTARAGTYNSRLQRLEARGDVVVVREDGKRFTSEKLVYDQVRNQFYSDTSFVLNEPRRELTGIGFESDPQLNNFRCLRACKGVAPVDVPTR